MNNLISVTSFFKKEAYFDGESLWVVLIWPVSSGECVSGEESSSVLSLVSRDDDRGGVDFESKS
jgi:hypothetical protein